MVIGIFLGLNTQLLNTITLKDGTNASPYMLASTVYMDRQENPGVPGSEQFMQSDTVNTDWQNYQDIPDTFEIVAENADFQLFTDKTTLAFKVVDKRSGYVWHSNLDEVGEDDRLNRTWTAFARSGISIDYLDQKAIKNVLPSLTQIN